MLTILPERNYAKIKINIVHSLSYNLFGTYTVCEYKRSNCILLCKFMHHNTLSISKHFILLQLNNISIQ